MKSSLAVSALLLALAHPAAAKPLTYDIDPGQTQVRFAVKMCEADILMGEFQDVQGTILFDEENPSASKVDVTIHADSAHYSKEYHKEDHLKTIIDGEKILNTPRFPTITFRSTAIEKTSETTGWLTGDMTFAGVTKPFRMEVTFQPDVGMTAAGRDLIALSADGRFTRSDFGVIYGLDRIGIRRMDDEVRVLITVTANRRKES